MDTTDSGRPPFDKPAEVVVHESAAPVAALDDSRTFEIGVGAFVLEGGGSGAYAGISPFLVGELGQGVFLRPSLALGQSLIAALHSTWGAARFDTCARVAGVYPKGAGIQLDLCGGLDVGFSYVASGAAAGTPAIGQTLPFVDLGPSVDLRAEMGSSLAVTLRAVVGVDIVRENFRDATGARVDTSMWPLRVELGISWDLYGLNPVSVDPSTGPSVASPSNPLLENVRTSTISD